MARRTTALGAAVGAALALGGCAELQEPDVEHTATSFADASADAALRCALLAPETLRALELDEESPCAQAIGEVPLGGGPVESVEVWGEEAQVRLSGDTLFLTRTPDGWRVTAASCTPAGEGRYDCRLEA
ncbi:hypothetical protein [Blastococcus sp. SYSU D00820]